MKRKISLKINGKTYSHEVEPRLLLIHYLREVAGLTGPHIGCETSICGACTVAVDGKAVKSLHHVRRAGRRPRSRHHRRPRARTATCIPCRKLSGITTALQCGFCTPGMIMASRQLLERNPNPSDEEIRHGLEGNLCRCTGYQHIVEAVKAAAAKAGA